MSRGAGPRRRRAARPPSDGLLPWALALPARMHLRWLVILVVTGAVMGAYGHALLTAAPMPPSKAPAAGGTAYPEGTPAATHPGARPPGARAGTPPGAHAGTSPRTPAASRSPEVG
ncbi:hypothetical protein [Actinacidiphila bryophytorum]|uniref:Uncharacterized protein n=1 Tax=Actinacidiphila bryophytorum TaxID=1436133 RepID=A0A9W4ME76_9ACTN|nr:hypothetical protein [Actinacidiphila bryophytorum]MBM9440846.1 hypothetical protein [Actinacidiphila bryophytorum]MBN6547537.1 hypothetical protein [Actinacidiphila bryophytorum]CAG7652367.1 hypothetical protein SBRY_50858 [Actinacidiphila bryophytorum]